MIDRGMLVAVCVSLSLLAAGCAQLQATHEQIDQHQTAAQAWRDKYLARAASAAVTRQSGPRLAGDEVRLLTGEKLPALFEQSFSYATQGGQTLGDVMQSVSAQAGLRLELGNGLPSSGSLELAPSLSASPGQGQGALAVPVILEYHGSLSGFLNELAQRHDVSWRYHAPTHAIEFYRFETRSLSLHIPPGAKAIAASISLAGVAASSGGGPTAGGSGNVAISQNLQVNPWAGVIAGIQAILGVAGQNGPTGAAIGAGSGGAAASGLLTAQGIAGRASANPELGLITVTARPAILDRVAAYVDSVNARFARNVLIDIKVYGLTLDQQVALGFSLDALYARLGQWGLSVVGAPPLLPATGTPGQFTLRANESGGPWSGSRLMAQALSQFGRVALLTQGQVLAVNGQPSPIQVANEINYLASAATSTAANVGATSTLTPGSRVVGFTANFLPLILGDNRILLQYQLQLSSLTALTQVSSGGNSIQTPQIASQSLQQQAFVRDGQAIVLFGFDQSRDMVDGSGGLGSLSRTSRSERQMVVIVMQVSAGGLDE